MKLHRVLLFTSIQMNITPVGNDLHVLLTSDNIPYIGSTVYAKVLPDPAAEDWDIESSILDEIEEAGEDGEAGALTDADAAGEAGEPVIELYKIDNHSDADSLFCSYVARTLAKKTGQNVLCTGGIFAQDPSERDISKLYENVDEMIHDWTVFFTDD